MNPAEFYQNQIHNANHKISNLSKLYNLISSIRLILIVILFLILRNEYLNPNPLNWILAFIPIIAFILFMSWHKKIDEKLKYQKAKLKINEDEMAYLNNQINQFDSGTEFIKNNHPYSYDLDLFGPKSLFQNINRTHSFRGKKLLAEKFNSINNNSEKIVLSNQIIKELINKPNFIEDFQIHSYLSNDNEKKQNAIENWANSNLKFINPLIKIISFISPLSLAILITLKLTTNIELLGSFIGLNITLNLAILAYHFKLIKAEISEADKIDESLLEFSKQFKLIENENFDSLILINFKNELGKFNQNISLKINKLSQNFSALYGIANPIGAVLFNGLFLYHIHILNQLNKLKSEIQLNLISLLNQLAEIEAFISLAKFGFNHPNLKFAEISDHFLFSEMGHPLIPQNKRINNSIKIEETQFHILTGSNMSGKSTFLRSIGINLVLANIGAPVCAKELKFIPCPLWVSMRQSDNLSDGESFFFAEVKRLKTIMEFSSQERSFVLLDEILKGTNSDDKRSGTIGVIEKFIQLNTPGIIATHDLEVCNIESKYPARIENYCFESQIINNELSFDYRLNKGICRNKSATFLMKKMQIIANEID